MFKRKKYLIFKFDETMNFQFVVQLSSKKEAKSVALEIERDKGFYAVVIKAKAFYFLINGRLV